MEFISKEIQFNKKNRIQREIGFCRMLTGRNAKLFEYDNYLA